LPEKPKVIVICGPTGIGKTAVGIELAGMFGGEIISSDSMQIYRHMDIGTAKPSPEELVQITHHMIDIVDPDEDFDAAQFLSQGRAIIAELGSRGRIPFVVGGTGLYIKALLHGIFQSQSIVSDVRERLKKEADEFGSHLLYDRLKQCDPESAGRLHPNDTYRIIRALEVFESTGRTIGAYHRDHDFTEDPYCVLKIGLTGDRQSLYHRIDYRVDAMIEAGLVDEVRRLLEMGFSADLKSMRSIGYRHMTEFLGGHLSWDECVRTLKRDTRRYAKRQLTWFGADRTISWQAPVDVKDIISLVGKFVRLDAL
jgi:tRNA dimethylallyltransferase